MTLGDNSHHAHRQPDYLDAAHRAIAGRPAEVQYWQPKAELAIGSCAALRAKGAWVGLDSLE